MWNCEWNDPHGRYGVQADGPNKCWHQGKTLSMLNSTIKCRLICSRIQSNLAALYKYCWWLWTSPLGLQPRHGDDAEEGLPMERPAFGRVRQPDRRHGQGGESHCRCVRIPRFRPWAKLPFGRQCPAPNTPSLELLAERSGLAGPSCPRARRGPPGAGGPASRMVDRHPGRRRLRKPTRDIRPGPRRSRAVL